MSPIRLIVTAALSLAFTAPIAAQPAVQTIYLASYNYAPKPIHLRAGRPVTLTFVNRSNSGHDFTAPGFFASSRILAGAAPAGKIGMGPGQSRSITLVPRAGVYRVHCSHFLHATFGMTDTIVVN